MCCQSLEISLGMRDTFQRTSGSAAGMGAWEFQVRLHGLRLTPLNRLCSQYICRAASSQGGPSKRAPAVQLRAAAADQERATHCLMLPCMHIMADDAWRISSKG